VREPACAVDKVGGQLARLRQHCGRRSVGSAAIYRRLGRILREQLHRLCKLERSQPLNEREGKIEPGRNSPRRLEIVAWDLSRAGCSDDVIEKILGSNFFRVFEQVWKERR